MARLNLSQPSAAVFTIHEEVAENGAAGHKSSNKARRAKYSGSDRSSDRSSNSNSNSDDSTRHDETDKKPRSLARTKSRDEENENENDGGSLTVRFTSLKIKESANDGDEENRDAEPTPPRRKTKSRRPLGSTRANPLLLPLSSSSAKKERYSLTNLENFHPKSENWEDEDDAHAKPNRSSKGSDETKSKPSRGAARVGRSENIPAVEERSESGDGFESLDDFIISDDEDISYHDSEQDIKEENDEEEEEKEEIILMPKTPRRLFRGRRPAQAKHDNGEQHDSTTESESLATAKELPNTTLSKGKGIIPRFDLKRTLTAPKTQDTPVKKNRDTTMYADDVFQERRAEE